MISFSRVRKRQAGRKMQKNATLGMDVVRKDLSVAVPLTPVAYGNGQQHSLPNHGSDATGLDSPPSFSAAPGDQLQQASDLDWSHQSSLSVNDSTPTSIVPSPSESPSPFSPRLPTNGSSSNLSVVLSSICSNDTATEQTTAVSYRVRFLLRSIARCITYFAYDCASLVMERDFARVGKVCAEMAIDEASPPVPRRRMTVPACFVEYLAPCALSSLVWFVIRKAKAKSRIRGTLLAKAVWTVIHRVLRQAIICRLFFQIGSLKYNLATLLGVICSFFRDDIFFELHRVDRWPKYFVCSQGLRAILRSLAYSAAFLLPLQKWCQVLEVAQRRRNVKKLIFAISLANVGRLRAADQSVAETIVPPR